MLGNGLLRGSARTIGLTILGRHSLFSPSSLPTNVRRANSGVGDSSRSPRPAMPSRTLQVCRLLIAARPFAGTAAASRPQTSSRVARGSRQFAPSGRNRSVGVRPASRPASPGRGERAMPVAIVSASLRARAAAVVPCSEWLRDRRRVDSHARGLTSTAEVPPDQRVADPVWSLGLRFWVDQETNIPRLAHRG